MLALAGRLRPWGRTGVGGASAGDGSSSLISSETSTGAGGGGGVGCILIFDWFSQIGGYMEVWGSCSIYEFVQMETKTVLKYWKAWKLCGKDVSWWLLDRPNFELRSFEITGKKWAFESIWNYYLEFIAKVVWPQSSREWSCWKLHTRGIRDWIAIPYIAKSQKRGTTHHQLQ